ncbi:MAG: hypothetical protein QOD45_165 [Pseudonocardiales bacterium]|jgi:hypothetical protein|nr:hypothetical protein [Pseudonocardiales bacterium]
MKELLPILIVLACPLMMILLMRAMHGGLNDHTRHMGCGGLDRSG